MITPRVSRTRQLCTLYAWLPVIYNPEGIAHVPLCTLYARLLVIYTCAWRWEHLAVLGSVVTPAELDNIYLATRVVQWTPWPIGLEYSKQCKGD